MAFTVNGELVDDSLVRAEASALRPRYEEVAQGMDPIEAEMQLREWSKENVIERVLLRQEAAADPEPIPAEALEQTLQSMRAQPDANESEMRKDVEIRMRVDRLLEKITSKVAPPKHKELSEYYRKNKEQFRRPELIHAAHIVKNVGEGVDEAAAQAAIQKVEEELKGGAVFEELADLHSDCAGNRGDLGWVPRGEMVQEFEDVIFALKDNEVSGIFRTVFGFHIAKVYGRKPEGFTDLSEVQSSIQEALHRQKQERAVENYLDRLKAKAVIQELPRKA
ncbi:MAG TPA: peptidylprolyl isomerase [Bryobacteraceae bacterium]|jgi:parvulin-like peptidyl-prolyl isomerase|nr:peptidylprolyl isomerase [Bryobacteraceae bacterium]